MRALRSIDAWQRATPKGMNGNKGFMNLAGVPVGPARLPSLPMSTAGAGALKAAHEGFCATADGKGLKMCSGH